MTPILHALSWAWAHPLDIAIWALLVPSLAFVLAGVGWPGIWAGGGFGCGRRKR